MIGTRVFLGKRERDEAEKPFWISFSDFMTALMTLFLIVMVVSLLSMTKQLRDVQLEDRERQEDIDKIWKDLKLATNKFTDVHLSKNMYTINFGEKATFPKGKHNISADGARLIRKFIPSILHIAKTTEGKRWFKRVVAEGFTDTTGDYLPNLSLSLQRAQRVVCVLLENVPDSESPLTDEQRRLVQQLFLVGGFSFNTSKESDEESRRVELRLEFRALKEKTVSPSPIKAGYGRCQLDHFQ